MYNVNHTVKYGLNYTYHRLTPNVANFTNGEQNFTNADKIKAKYAHETALSKHRLRKVLFHGHILL